jgi:hypothetical protein
MAQTWAVVATVKEDIETIKAFVAHYKSIGADEIHLYFDDPDDPALEIAAAVPGVRATACDAAFWGGKRPAAHQARQKNNAHLTYGQVRTDWIIHLDADELLHADEPIAGLLGSVAPEVAVLRAIPAEALVSDEADGANMFRLPLPRTPRGQRIGHAVYGEIYPLLEGGLLSHVAGKYFVRTGRADVQLTIHAPFVARKRELGTTLPGLHLLHLHGGDEEKWIASVQRRLDRGAYQAKFIDDRRGAGKVDGLARNAYLRRLIDEEGVAGLRRFHRDACRFEPRKRALRRANALLRVNLDLPEKVRAWFPAEGDGAS